MFAFLFSCLPFSSPFSVFPILLYLNMSLKLILKCSASFFLFLPSSRSSFSIFPFPLFPILRLSFFFSSSHTVNVFSFHHFIFSRPCPLFSLNILYFVFILLCRYYFLSLFALLVSPSSSLPLSIPLPPIKSGACNKRAERPNPAITPKAFSLSLLSPPLPRLSKNSEWRQETDALCDAV